MRGFRSLIRTRAFLQSSLIRIWLPWLEIKQETSIEESHRYRSMCRCDFASEAFYKYSSEPTAVANLKWPLQHRSLNYCEANNRHATTQAWYGFNVRYCRPVRATWLERASLEWLRKCYSNSLSYVYLH